MDTSSSIQGRRPSADKMAKLFENVIAQIRGHLTVISKGFKLYGIARVSTHKGAKWSFGRPAKGLRIFPIATVPFTMFDYVAEALRINGYNVEITEDSHSRSMKITNPMLRPAWDRTQPEIKNPILP